MPYDYHDFHKSHTKLSNIMAKIGGSAAWIVAIYISILAIIVFYITSKLYSNFEGKDIIDIGEILGGKALKIPLGILIIVFSCCFVCILS